MKKIRIGSAWWQLMGWVDNHSACGWEDEVGVVRRQVEVELSPLTRWELIGVP